MVRIQVVVGQNSYEYMRFYNIGYYSLYIIMGQDALGILYLVMEIRQ